MRSLLAVLDQLCSVAPELEHHFTKLRRDIAYTPPELARENWWAAYEILTKCALNHPRREELSRIFVGK